MCSIVSNENLKSLAKYNSTLYKMHVEHFMTVYGQNLATVPIFIWALLVLVKLHLDPTGRAVHLLGLIDISGNNIISLQKLRLIYVIYVLTYICFKEMKHELFNVGR